MKLLLQLTLAIFTFIYMKKLMNESIVFMQSIDEKSSDTGNIQVCSITPV